MTVENNSKKVLRRRSFRRVKKGLAAILTVSVLAAGSMSYYEGMQAKATAAQKMQEAQDIVTQSDQEVDDKNIEVQRLEETNEQLRNENRALQGKLEEARREVSRGSSDDVSPAGGFDVVVTAYTLSEASCSKGTSHPAYGRTANGTNLAGHSLYSARAIAVDPRIIPLGTRVKIQFKDPEMRRFNGVYTAVDTGGAIKGNRIDLFAGEGAESLAMHIGRRQAAAALL